MKTDIETLNRACALALLLISQGEVKAVPDLESGGAEIGVTVVADYSAARFVPDIIKSIPADEVAKELMAMAQELELKLEFDANGNEIFVFSDDSEDLWAGIEEILADISDYLNLPVQIPNTKQSFIGLS
ncbi:MAG: hypothetical protein COV36_02005 [Alphaproteobacteria bacterium CG11_big_fil_rev_8_21_14_0_20_44_7]|nr:MAG: hypothetical protein COV36_02005 [Alphaproteobacteria bacterium CG11_big_fil_rev_8_21_14_0_20_44_7]